MSAPSVIILFLWVVTLCGGILSTATPSLWALDVDMVMSGEWWRLLSGHFTHLSWQHLWVDEAAFAMALFICLRTKCTIREIAGAATVSAAAVTWTIVVIRPVAVYGGLSGISVGILVYAALKLCQGAHRRLGFWLILMSMFKLVSEGHGFSVSQVVPVWQAHCAGCIGGLLWWGAEHAAQRAKQFNNVSIRIFVWRVCKHLGRSQS